MHSKKLNINVNGNRKLQNNDSTRFIIWNLPACRTCPFATPHCIGKCYARKSEKAYPNVLPSRENNLEDSKSDSFVSDMIATLEKELSSKKYIGKMTYFRIHESGDFYSKEYLEKWLEVIKHFEGNKSLVFVAYTKSLPYFEGIDLKQYPNFSLLASVWDDTKPEMLELIKKNHYNVYTATESFEGYNGFKCHCKDCASCRGCFHNCNKEIACEIH